MNSLSLSLTRLPEMYEMFARTVRCILAVLPRGQHRVQITSAASCVVCGYEKMGAPCIKQAGKKGRVASIGMSHSFAPAHALSLCLFLAQSLSCVRTRLTPQTSNQQLSVSTSHGLWTGGRAWSARLKRRQMRSPKSILARLSEALPAKCAKRSYRAKTREAACLLW